MPLKKTTLFILSVMYCSLMHGMQNGYVVLPAPPDLPGVYEVNNGNKKALGEGLYYVYQDKAYPIISLTVDNGGNMMKKIGQVATKNHTRININSNEKPAPSYNQGIAAAGGLTGTLLMPLAVKHILQGNLQGPLYMAIGAGALAVGGHYSPWDAYTPLTSIGTLLGVTITLAAYGLSQAVNALR